MEKRLLNQDVLTAINVWDIVQLEPLPGDIVLKKYDAIIIGSGLGGLLTALNLVELGKKVIIIEKLVFLGGRFTNIEYKGYQLSTGAVHMIPYGKKGPLGKMLKKFKVPLVIEPVDVFSSWISKEQYFEDKNLMGLFAFLNNQERFDLLKLVIKPIFLPIQVDLSFKNWLSQNTKSDKIHLFFNKIIEYSMSIRTEQLSAKEAIAFCKHILLLRKPGIIKGGCKSLIDELVKMIESKNKGIILNDTEVTRIIIEGGSVKGVEIKKKNGNVQKITSDLIISNCGPKKTVELINSKKISKSYLEKINRIKPANGVQILFSSDIPLINHRGVLFTLDTNRISGIIQPSNSDSTLSPNNKHLLIAHMVVHRDLEEDIKLAIEDLKKLFPEFENKCEILSIGRFRSEWPVNYTRQGEEIDNRTPLRGLYLVGDGNKSKGFIMTEGIAKGVERTMQYINDDSFI